MKLNDAAQLESIWEKAREVQSFNTKILLKVQDVPETQVELNDFRAALKNMIKSHNLDGIDFHVTWHHSINSTVALIDFLKTSFGYHFIIVISPHITALQGRDEDSRYNYEYLEMLRGDQIAWYSLNTYSPICQQTAVNALDMREYEDIINRGWPMQKIILGIDASIDHWDGFVFPTTLNLFLAAIRMRDVACFMGVSFWICMKCSHNAERSGEWMTSVNGIIPKCFKNPFETSAERYNAVFGMQTKTKPHGRGTEMFTMLEMIGLEPKKSEIRRMELVSARDHSFEERAVPPLSDIMPMHLKDYPLFSKKLKYISSSLIDKGSAAVANRVHSEAETEAKSPDEALMLSEFGTSSEAIETTDFN